MKPLQIAVVLLSLLVVCPTQQTGASSGTIILRMLNGKTGKPIKHDLTNIWLGDAATFSLVQTNSKGEITINIGNVQPFEIRVLPGNHVDCRSIDSEKGGRLVRYSIEEISSKGVAGENLCGKAGVLPAPGVLVIYARPMTFIEGMKV
jgi:hypothetical protein